MLGSPSRRIVVPKTFWCGVLTVVATIGLSAQSARAATITRVVGSLKDAVTGQELCQPTVPPARRYTTIQAAVDASIASSTPATIWVCPGRYAEQVRIGNTDTYEPIMTIQGSNLTSGPAVIAPPSTWTTYA